MSVPAFDAAGPGTAAEVWRHHLDPGQRPAVGLEDVQRVVVVGAHPDDESLGAGGLVALARDRGLDVDLVCVTDGRASHPDSPTHPPEHLARRRAVEWEAAADLLDVGGGHRHWLGYADGDASSNVDEVTARLVELLGDGRGAILAAPWRADGHPDHEAVGRAAAAAARRTDAELWEYPVWFWHWASPRETRAGLLRPLALSASARARKAAAVAAHLSQVTALSGLARDEVLPSPDVLAHFAGELEWYAVTPGRRCPDDALERLHGQVNDPWGVDTRWYERRKRALLLAMLPRHRFRCALEVGCSTGALTESLATRADRVVAVDSSPAALRAARLRLADRPEVEVQELEVPAQWPDGEFDLVVVSEIGYFLSPAALDGVVRRVQECASPDAVVALCHWRHRVVGWVPDADQVHRSFEAGLTLPLRATYRDPDVDLQVHAHEWPAYDR